LFKEAELNLLTDYDLPT